MAIHSLKLKYSAQGRGTIKIVGYVDDLKIGEKEISEGSGIVTIGELNWDATPRRHFKIEFYRDSEYLDKIEFEGPYIEKIDVHYYRVYSFRTGRYYPAVTVRATIVCPWAESNGLAKFPLYPYFYIGITIGNVDFPPLKLKFGIQTSGYIQNEGIWVWTGHRWSYQGSLGRLEHGNKFYVVFDTVSRYYPYAWTDLDIKENHHGVAISDRYVPQLRYEDVKGKTFYIATWAGFDESRNVMVGRYDIKWKTI